jgi:hypothetical protein
VPLRTGWHHAFVEALQMELYDYRDALEFHSEVQLTAEPLRIDCVVIRKAKDVAIKKNILLEHLQNDRGYTVAETVPGIYTVSGDIMPIQVIESRRLPAEENVWLKSLRGRLNDTEKYQISTEIARQGKDARIAAYVHAIAKANPGIIQEIFMKNSLTFEQALENVGLTAKWEARGRTEGKTEEAFAIARNMVNMGLPLETVVSATRLEPEKIKALYQG